MQCVTVVMKVYAVPVMIKYSRLFWFYRTASIYRKLYLVHTVRLFIMEFRM
jgi:ribosomal protein S19E (S16A)